MGWNATFGAALDINFGGGTATFPGLTLGTGQVLVYVYNNAGNAITGVTAAGVSLTNIATTTDNHGSWWRGAIASATGSVVVTASTFGTIAVSGGIATGIDPTSATSVIHQTDSVADPQTCGPITVPVGGFAVAAIGEPSRGTTVNIPATWNTGTLDSVMEASVTTGNGAQISGGHLTTSGSQTFSVTGGGASGFGFNAANMIAVAFAPLAVIETNPHWRPATFLPQWSTLALLRQNLATDILPPVSGDTPVYSSPIQLESQWNVDVSLVQGGALDAGLAPETNTFFARRTWPLVWQPSRALWQITAQDFSSLGVETNVHFIPRTWPLQWNLQRSLMRITAQDFSSTPPIITLLLRPLMGTGL